jgi:2-oxoglutarate ferredoxin oxidoreductase subunit alpha
VVLLLDATLSHMRENVLLPEVPVEERRAPASLEGFEPFAGAEFLPFGAGARIVVTGLAHQASGRPAASDGAGAERMLRQAITDVETDPEVFLHRAEETDDAELVILAYGITARAAKAAVRLLRTDGVRTGLVELQTLWPFPERLVARLAEQTEVLLVPELNLGQMVLPVRAAAAGRARVVPLNRADGVLFSPEEIAQAARRALTEREAVNV